MDISDFRQQYTQQGLNREQLHPDPFEQFELWFQEACTADLPEANAMSLATVSPAGDPAQRMVLLKYFDRQGLFFFTNYASKKALHIKANDRVSLLFFWAALERQLQISGNAAKISTGERKNAWGFRDLGI